ncbi:colicin D domain-containing protein [Mycobacterium sp.]|uniref:colicin D domain-containing protein n=1 Tax=Mycobacterium sp. TaxID=1785 RepID=UPI003D11A48F
MAAVAGTPNLSALLAWPTDHLTEAASHWESVGDRSYGVAHGVWSDALTVDWDGEAADALRTDTHADLMTTSGVVDQLQEAATVARQGASELTASRSQLRYAVEDARSAGFEVGEDLSVTDRMSGGSAAQRAARQAAAEAHAGNIGGRAAQLVSADAQVASRVTAAVAGVGSTFPQTPSTNGQISAVDSRTFKQDPSFPVSPNDMTKTEALAAWEAINAEQRAWNARCGVENVGPLPPAQYNACLASQSSISERKAAIRDRLRQLGVPVEGEGPSSPGENTGGGAPPPKIDKVPLQTDSGQIEAKYKHAEDFGVTDPRGRAGFDKFENALKAVVDDPSTVHIQGTYRGQPAILNYNPDSGVCVIQSPGGQFVSGFKLSPGQVQNVLGRGSLGGGD